MNKFLHSWYKMRGLLIVPLLAFIFFCTWNESEHHLLALSLGSIFFALGLAIRIWAQMHLKYRLKSKTKLTITGPYVYVRNPIYIANTMLIIGISIMMELLWSIPIVVLYCFFVYMFVVKYEEYHLEKKYGREYSEFLKRTPRFIPSLKPTVIPSKYHSTSIFFWPSLKAEYQCIFLLILPILKGFIF